MPEKNSYGQNVMEKIHFLMDGMEEQRLKEKKKRKEIQQAFQELEGIQRYIASLEQDITAIREEYRRLDEEARPLMACYVETATNCSSWISGQEGVGVKGFDVFGELSPDDVLC